jgi:hypothetical protein
MILKAKSHILYKGNDYIPGDILPECELTESWLASGAAFWDKEQPLQALPKARLVTAVPGLVGYTPQPETTETLVGKVPITEARKKPPASARRSRRKKVYE